MASCLRCSWLVGLVQGDAGVTELLGNVDAEVTLLAPANQGLAIEKLEKPATPVRSLPETSSLCSMKPLSSTLNLCLVAERVDMLSDKLF